MDLLLELEADWVGAITSILFSEQSSGLDPEDLPGGYQIFLHGVQCGHPILL